MLYLTSILQTPSGPSRPAMQAARSQLRVNRTGRVLLYSIGRYRHE